MTHDPEVAVDEPLEVVVPPDRDVTGLTIRTIRVR
jgi:hypothetical protein